MIFEAFKWFLAAASLVGVVLNVHKQRACFAVWLCTNACWVAVAPNGKWSAVGWKGKDKSLSDSAFYELNKAGAVVHFVEADVPLPASETVEGRVVP